MCKYYAHAFVCHHTTFTFARYCTSANFTQKPCEQRQIWHTIGLDEACDECQMWYVKLSGPLCIITPPRHISSRQRHLESYFYFLFFSFRELTY